MLTIRSLHASLGRTAVLHGITASAAPGRIVAVIGPNGSGKTTLLRAISGDVAYDGRIALDGADLADLKPWELAARRAATGRNAGLSVHRGRGRAPWADVGYAG